MLSARACFPRLVNRPVFSFDPSGKAPCSISDLPGTPFLPRHSFPLTFQSTCAVHCVVHLCTGPSFLHRSSGRLSTREGCQGCGASPGLRNQMLSPRRAVRRRPVLWARERREQSIPQRKDYIIDRQEQTKCPWLHYQAWAHYNTFRGAPFPREMSQSEVLIVQNQSPNQTRNASRAVPQLCQSTTPGHNAQHVP